MVASVSSDVPLESETLAKMPPSNRRGQNRREQHSAIRKAKVIHDYEAGISQDVIAAKYNINRSLVSKWHSDRVKILACAASEYKKHLKIRPARKYNELYRQFLIDFKTARSKGHRVNFGWLWSKARTIYRKQKNDPNVIVRKHFITAFIKRHGIRMRARQRNRKQSKEAFRNDLMKWHGTTRERLVKTGKDDQYDQKWGRFVPTQRFNVDNRPCPLPLKRNGHMKSLRRTKVKITRYGSANPEAVSTSVNVPCKFALDLPVSNRTLLSSSVAKVKS